MPVPDMESTFYAYVERFRTLLAADAWQRIFLDLSKNDFLTLIFLRRAGNARMSEVANYLTVPLNTATGVVSRLQRRGFVERRNSLDDKRVVEVSLSEPGRDLITRGFREAARLVERALGELSDEQLTLLFGAVDRIVELVSEPAPEPAVPQVRRIPIN